MKLSVAILILSVMLVSCSRPEARKPIVRKTSSFMSESIERNKLLNKVENDMILNKIKADTLHEYLNSESGFWYFYELENPAESYRPKRGDEVFFTHEIRALDDSLIYTREELGTKSYLIDKEDLISGLQDGFKLMREGEVVTFLFPSHKAYGYTGNERINPNQPLIYTVQLLKINKLSDNENN